MAENRRLDGMKHIEAYVHRTDNWVIQQVNERGFPATRLAGVWRAETAAIDAWMDRQELQAQGGALLRVLDSLQARLAVLEGQAAKGRGRGVGTLKNS